jgi:hypothetical protein
MHRSDNKISRKAARTEQEHSLQKSVLQSVSHYKQSNQKYGYLCVTVLQNGIITHPTQFQLRLRWDRRRVCRQAVRVVVPSMRSVVSSCVACTACTGVIEQSGPFRVCAPDQLRTPPHTACTACVVSLHS